MFVSTNIERMLFCIIECREVLAVSMREVVSEVCKGQFGMRVVRILFAVLG